jgi:flagellar protein FliO/FliZ
MNPLTNPIRQFLTAALAFPSVASALAKGNAPAAEAAGSVVQMILGLLLVVALIFVFAWMARRFTNLPGVGQGAVRVLGGVSLGTRERAVLMQVGDTQLLVGVAPGRVQTLHVLERPVVVSGDSRHDGNTGFAERLAALLKQGRGA